MKTVFIRELLLAIRRLASYITIGVCALLTSIFFITSNLTYTATTIAAVVSFAQLVSAAAMPIFAVIVFSPSKKSNSDVFYDMLPLKSGDIFFGKYLAALSLFAISAAPMLFYPLIAGAFGAVDHAQCYLLILVYVLSEAAFLAVCSAVCIALRRSSKYVSLAVSYAVGLVMLFSGIANVVLSVKPVVSLVLFAVLIAAAAALIFIITRKIALSIGVFAALEGLLFALYFVKPDIFVCGFERFLDAVSVFDRISVFTSGIFDVSAIVFYVCAIAALVFIAYRAFVKKRSSRAVKGAISATLSVLVIVAMVLGNVALYFLPHNVIMSDMTVSSRNSVGNKAQRYLAEVDEPVTIYLLEPTGAVDYELYLASLAACSPNLTVEKIYYNNTPEFYSERGISFDSANSLYIESARRGDYLSYLNLFSYTNSELGLSGMSISEYQYYYNLFSSNSSYSSYLSVLLYNTVENYNADAMICALVEYVTKDVIPTSYYLTGHGERAFEEQNGAFSGVGLYTCTLEDGVPADAASILINAPTSDISEAERDALLGFLERGGEITFITTPENIAMPNLMAILAEYGMSATADIVTVEKTTAEKTSEGDDQSEEDSGEEDGKEMTSELTPVINTQSDVMEVFGDSDYTFSVKDANAIVTDDSAKPALILTPLLVAVDGETQYTIACSAETAAGARIAWFTGAESYNDAKSLARFGPIYASAWTIIKYESDVTGIESVVYEPLATAITSKGKVAAAALLIIAPLAFVIYGAVSCTRRRRIKA